MQASDIRWETKKKLEIFATKTFAKGEEVNSLVDKEGEIGPKEQDGQWDYERMANKSEQMITSTFKEKPYDSGTSEHSSWNLLLPP